jgi:hypothetical protein
MRASVVIAAVASLALGGGARAEDTTFTLLGMGALSCAHGLSDKFMEDVGQQWIGGFWSGLNLFSNTDRRVGHAVDIDDIFGEVRQICVQHPSKPLHEAVREVYAMIAKQHR